MASASSNKCVSVVTAIVIVVLVIANAANATHANQQEDQDNWHMGRPSKRTVDFMGIQVSYPQYVRLRSIQREVIKMDRIIRRMMRTHAPLELAQNPLWIELLELYDATKKMLPEEYLRSVATDSPIPI